MVERQIGLPITSRVVNNLNPVPVEIFNSEALGEKRPFRKTRLMRKIEKQRNGTPIERILHNLYWDQKKSYRDIVQDLDLKDPKTVSSWMHRLDVRTRSPREGYELYSRNPQKLQDSAKRIIETRKRRKIARIRQALGIEENQGLKTALEEIYKKEGSKKRIRQRIRETGVVVSSHFIGKLAEEIGAQLQKGRAIEIVAQKEEKAKKKEELRAAVRKAHKNGSFSLLTPRQQLVLGLRFLYKDKQPTHRECAEMLGTTRSRQAIQETERSALRKLGL